MTAPNLPGAVLVAVPCDFCGVRALCIPLQDDGDGAIDYACGRCASSPPKEPDCRMRPR